MLTAPGHIVCTTWRRLVTLYVRHDDAWLHCMYDMTAPGHIVCTTWRRLVTLYVRHDGAWSHCMYDMTAPGHIVCTTWRRLITLYVQDDDAWSHCMYDMTTPGHIVWTTWRRLVTLYVRHRYMDITMILSYRRLHGFWNIYWSNCYIMLMLCDISVTLLLIYSNLIYTLITGNHHIKNLFTHINILFTTLLLFMNTCCSLVTYCLVSSAVVFVLLVQLSCIVSLSKWFVTLFILTNCVTLRSCVVIT